MSDFLISVLAFIVAISLLVAVHEFGHFWVARRLGIRVLRFSIGFGKPLWRYVAGRDRTEYVISAVPLGGYVKLLDEREGPIEPTEQHRAFNRQPIPNRMAVLVAGPLFNFLFAVAAYWLLFVIGVVALRPVIGTVEPETAAARAGLETDDEIVVVGEQAVGTRQSALLAMLEELIDDGVIPMTVKSPSGVERRLVLEVPGRQSELTEPGALLPGLGFSFWRPTQPAIIEALTDENGPAARAGIIPGDRVVAVDDEPIEDWFQLVERIRTRPGETTRLELERGGERLTVEVAVEAVDEDGQTYGRIGVQGLPFEGLPEGMLTEQRYGPLASVFVASTKTWEMSVLTVQMLGRMITGDVSIKNISGPINIAEYAGQTARSGLTSFLQFLAIVSISLGILNLLPIPMLDGGQLVYQTVELVKGSPLSERTQLIGQHIGIALLLLLMSFAFYNDISRLMN